MPFNSDNYRKPTDADTNYEAIENSSTEIASKQGMNALELANNEKVKNLITEVSGAINRAEAATQALIADLKYSHALNENQKKEIEKIVKLEGSELLVEVRDMVKSAYKEVNTEVEKRLNSLYIDSLKSKTEITDNLKKSRSSHDQQIEKLKDERARLNQAFLDAEETYTKKSTQQANAIIALTAANTAEDLIRKKAGEFGVINSKNKAVMDKAEESLSAKDQEIFVVDQEILNAKQTASSVIVQIEKETESKVGELEKFRTDSISQIDKSLSMVDTVIAQHHDELMSQINDKLFTLKDGHLDQQAKKIFDKKGPLAAKISVRDVSNEQVSIVNFAESHLPYEFLEFCVDNKCVVLIDQMPASSLKTMMPKFQQAIEDRFDSIDRAAPDSMDNLETFSEFLVALKTAMDMKTVSAFSKPFRSVVQLKNLVQTTTNIDDELKNFKQSLIATLQTVDAAIAEKKELLASHANTANTDALLENYKRGVIRMIGPDDKSTSVQIESLIASVHAVPGITTDELSSILGTPASVSDEVNASVNPATGLYAVLEQRRQEEVEAVSASVVSDTSSESSENAIATAAVKSSIINPSRASMMLGLMAVIGGITAVTTYACKFGMFSGSDAERDNSMTTKHESDSSYGL